MVARLMLHSKKIRYMQKEFDKVRRTDRQNSDPSFLQDLLLHSMSCTIAVATSDYPLIHASFFAYDQGTDEIIFHFSRHGFGAQEMVHEKKVAISLYKFGKLYTATKAVDFGGEYQSVVIYGQLKLVEEETEKLQAMEFFFQKYFGHISKDAYTPTNLTEIRPIHVFKVKIDKWIGKEHRVPEKSLQSFDAGFKATM